MVIGDLLPTPLNLPGGNCSLLVNPGRNHLHAFLADANGDASMSFRVPARRGAPPKVMIQILYEQARADHPDELRRVNAISNEWANLVRDVKGLPLLQVEELELFTPPFTGVDICDGVALQFMPYHEWGEGQSGEKHFCSYPWRQLAIFVDGQATACCVDAREQTVEEIWEGPVLTRMRHAFWNDLAAVEPRCVRCPIRHWDVEQTYRNHPLR